MNTNTEFCSRWGFHPCRYELYLKLKRLHRWYWQTLYDFHRWHRWQRKQPQNRIGPEPTYCPVFVEDSVWYKPVRIRGANGFRVYPKTVVDLGILNLYQAARMPQPRAVAPFDSGTIERIESLYNEASTVWNE